MNYLFFGVSVNVMRANKFFGGFFVHIALRVRSAGADDVVEIGAPKIYFKLFQASFIRSHTCRLVVVHGMMMGDGMAGY